MAIDIAVEERPLFALGAVPAEVLVEECLLVKYGKYKQTTMRYVGPLK